MKSTFACVLKLGGDYKPEHVTLLAAQVKKYTTVDYDFVCYTDSQDEMPGVISIPLLENWPGWWSVPEVFRNVGPTIVVGVDTMITGNIDPLFKIAKRCSHEDFWMIHSWRKPVKTISGIMVYNHDWTWLYKEFDYKKISKRLRGEEDYTLSKLKERNIQPRILQKAFPGIYSWKRQCQEGIPADCKVLVFHGHPRPFEVPELWQEIVKEHA